MTARKPLIAGNWKLFKTIGESISAAEMLMELSKGIQDRDIMIAPTYISLASVSEAIKGSNISLGAQNLFWEKEGAYTGEISADMLLSAGCSYVIIGHSERRQYFGETDSSVNKKIKASIQANLIPVFCIGETDEERIEEKTFSVLDKQITLGLEGYSVSELENLVIAYEPVWAIGTGKTASVNQVQEVHGYIRSLIEKKFGNLLASSIRILYGGSVKPSNVNELMGLDDVDGALVGGASLDPKTFSQIVHFNL